jgi:hypothetical protein
MTDMFRKASHWLDERRHAVATSEVVYRRDDRTVSVRATIGRTEYQQDDGVGVITRAETRDFIIRARELLIDGVQVLPEVGDRVEEVDRGTLFIYEVLPVGSMQPHYRYSDQYRTTLRIHTKLVAEEFASSCQR